mgnify:CR=1 FL=1
MFLKNVHIFLGFELSLQGNNMHEVLFSDRTRTKILANFGIVRHLEKLPLKSWQKSNDKLNLDLVFLGCHSTI